MREFNARNLLCPMPVIKVQNTIKEMQPSQLLTVYCTDPGVKYDIPAWCRLNGHDVLAIQQCAQEIILTIKVGSGDEKQTT